jgi:chorismate mutase
MSVTCDNLEIQEEPTMGKTTKSEKLDLILSELTKLRRDVKKLLKDRAAVVNEVAKAKRGLALGRSKKLLEPTDAGKKPGRVVAQSKPVLVQPSQVPQPPSRSASR